MADPRPNGFRNRSTLTQTSYRDAVASTVAANRNGYSDQDMADVWGVSSGTVNNAQNKKNDLSALPLLKLGERFGLEAMNTVMCLIGGKVVPIDAVTVDVQSVPADIAGVVPLLIELFRDGECCNADVRRLEKAGAIDTILTVAEWLRQRRNDVRLEVVGAR